MFCIEYGLAIENVFISPLFLKLDTPDFLDNVMWLIPTLIDILIFPFVNVFFQNSKFLRAYRKNLMIIFSIMSVCGLLLLGYSKHITIYYISLQSNKKNYIMNIALTGFIIQDIGQDILTVLIQNFLLESIKPQDLTWANSYLRYSNSIGKIFAYLLSSILTFQIQLIEVSNFMQSLTFSYFLGAFINFSSIMIIIIKFNFNRNQIKPSSKRSVLKTMLHNIKFQNIESYLPCFKQLKNLDKKGWLLLLTHFFSCSSVYLVSVYGTLWTGIVMLENSPNTFSNKVRNQLFDLGISWGSLTMFLGALLHFFISFIIDNFLNYDIHYQQQKLIQLQNTYKTNNNITNLNLSQISQSFNNNEISFLPEDIGWKHFLQNVFGQYKQKQQTIFNKSQEKIGQFKYLVKIFFIISQLIPNIALVYTYFDRSFHSLLVSLPLWGISLATYQYLPEKIGFVLEKQGIFLENQSFRLLNISYLVCQIMLFLVIPLIFMEFKNIEDISMSLFMAGVSGIIGSIIAIFV